MLLFLGAALIFLAGTITEADLATVRGNIKTLASNQEEISHVLQDSLSILNITRTEVSENRQSINAIADHLHTINKEIDFIADQLGQQIVELQKFVFLFSRLSLVVQEIKTAIQRASYYFLHLQIQLNALSAQKLSPNTISPNEFRSLLQEIEAQLPKSYGFPADLNTNLWDFYKLLTCTTIVDGSQIIIIISIPLIDHSQKYDIYKTYNLKIDVSNNSQTEILTYYNLESKYIGINPQHTKYFSLDQHDKDACQVGFSKLCNVRKPVYQVNLSQ